MVFSFFISHAIFPKKTVKIFDENNICSGSFNPIFQDYEQKNLSELIGKVDTYPLSLYLNKIYL
jgi:hypothetical protein